MIVSNKCIGFNLHKFISRNIWCTAITSLTCFILQRLCKTQPVFVLENKELFARVVAYMKMDEVFLKCVTNA